MVAELVRIPIEDEEKFFGNRLTPPITHVTKSEEEEDKVPYFGAETKTEGQRSTR